MGLFRSSDNDDGCTAHHFADEFKEVWSDYNRDEGLMVTPRGEEHIPVVILRVDKQRVCLHDGCTVTDKTGIQRHYVVPRRALMRGGNAGRTDPPEDRRREYADRLRDVADQIDPDAGWEADDDE